ncbi:MAG: hypothetical protein U1E39_01890 [Planctomycetota bacterium]
MGERWLYRRWLWSTSGRLFVPALAFAAACLGVFLEDLEAAARVTVMVGAASAVFLDLRARGEATLAFERLATDFNGRYVALRSDLWAEVGGGGQAVSPRREAILTDYLILCAEEYLFFSMGLIPPIVWTSWRQGMSAVVNASPRVRTFCEEEVRRGSYYGFTLPPP